LNARESVHVLTHGLLFYGPLEVACQPTSTIRRVQPREPSCLTSVLESSLAFAGSDPSSLEGLIRWHRWIWISAWLPGRSNQCTRSQVINCRREPKRKARRNIAFCATFVLLFVKEARSCVERIAGLRVGSREQDRLDPYANTRPAVRRPRFWPGMRTSYRLAR